MALCKIDLDGLALVLVVIPWNDGGDPMAVVFAVPALAAVHAARAVPIASIAYAS